MNFAQVHLLLNHFPILGSIFGIALLLVAILRKSEELKRVTLGAFIVFALLALPVYFSGEPAEKIIEDFPGVTENVIHPHEVFAKYALIGIEILGVLSLMGWLAFRRSKAIPSGFVAAVFILSLVVAGLMVWTGHLGGMIRHTETRGGYQTQEGDQKLEIQKETNQAKPERD